jgi:hypothetical protein
MTGTCHYRVMQVSSRVATAPTPPPTVRWAIRLMLIGAALEIVTVVVAVNTENSLRPAFAAPKLSASAADLQDLAAHIQAEAAIWLIASVLWLVMAWANRRGNDWARIISAVLLAMGTKDTISAFADLNSAPTVAVMVATCITGLAAVVLLFSRQSGTFFRHGRAGTLRGRFPAQE